MNFEALLKKKREAELLRGQMERNALRSFEQDFLIEYTHNSTAIEGNTLTLLQTKVVLEDGISVGGKTVPFPVSWTVKMKKKQKETQDILSYHSQAAGCSDKARAKASGGRQPIEECGRTGL